jgi:hopanoid biosynthesis associated radical SAM protein HpnH
VEGIKLTCKKGFRAVINCTLYDGMRAEEIADFFDSAMALGIEGITVSPGYRYTQAPQKGIFLMRTQSKYLFRRIFKLGKDRKWRFNQSVLFLDFLAGNQAYQCTPWGNPTRNVFGWQRPCYLLVNEGYATSFKALMEETDWNRYGTGRNPKCADCMLHSGFEATAVNDTLAHPLKALSVYLRGPRTDGPMAEKRSRDLTEMNAIR